MRVGSRF